MSFFSKIPIQQLSNPISYDSKITSLGSCFAVHIAKKLNYYQFRNTVNPFGILFHPPAIEKIIDFAYKDKFFNEKDVFCHQEVWSSFDAHSECNQLSEEELIHFLQGQSIDLKKHLIFATHLIVTLGSSWVYRHKEQNRIVANCHKLPQYIFEKELLSVDDIKKSLNRMVEKIHDINPDIQIIYTISPVRHIKDGFVENQLSKAHLITALHQHLDKYSHIYYFPSYEIVMDELRDYRFYNADMIHPNEIAIQHIWERFCSSCIHESAIPLMTKVEIVQKMRSHLPFNPNSTEHKKFLKSLAQKLNRLQSGFPFMTFED